MKKSLLLLGFLASQLLAVQCTEEQYSPYFNDIAGSRYLFSSQLTSDNSIVVIDKKSIIYDKKNQMIVAWTINQTIKDPSYGYGKSKWEYNLKNNNTRYLKGTSMYNCKGTALINNDQSIGDWNEILPNSTSEHMLDTIKEYLKIK